MALRPNWERRRGGFLHGSIPDVPFIPVAIRFVFYFSSSVSDFSTASPNCFPTGVLTNETKHK